MRKPSTLSKTTFLLFAAAVTEPSAALRAACAWVVIALSITGCATNPNNDVLADPLKQRLIAREDIALQNLLLERMPVYAAYDSDAEARYDGPAIEPPLPDLNLLPEDMPPWEELPPISMPESSPPVDASAPEPTPAEPAAE